MHRRLPFSGGVLGLRKLGDVVAGVLEPAEVAEILKPADKTARAAGSDYPC